MYGTDDGDAFTAHVEPGEAAPLAAWLDRMRFMMRVEVEDVTEELAVAWRPVVSTGSTTVSTSSTTVSTGSTTEATSGKYDVFPRADLEKYAEAAGPACGMWAFEALRIARGEPRFNVDTDHRTIPNEVGWVSASSTPWNAVHLDKGCYRGQETVARVHTLGRPPRRLTLLHLDGSDNRLPTRGSAVTVSTGSTSDGSGKEIGVVGSSARHYELGPIALALIKRNVAVDAELEADGLPAGQEVVVDPEVGLHVRPLR
jgi:folate-binding protein YgfZ